MGGCILWPHVGGRAPDSCPTLKPWLRTRLSPTGSHRELQVCMAHTHSLLCPQSPHPQGAARPGGRPAATAGFPYAEALGSVLEALHPQPDLTMVAAHTGGEGNSREKITINVAKQ